MAMQWFYVVDGERFGPVTEEALVQLARDGRLSKEDLVWNETLQNEWVEAGTVPHLFGLPDELPPPLPSEEPVPPPLAPLAPVAPLPPALEPEPEPAPEYGHISLTEPVGRAWDRMKRILFSPFEMGKWFVLGFTAWLTMASLGGFTSPGNFGDHSAKGMGHSALGPFAMVFAVIILVVVVLSLAAEIALAWVRARGQFMFLDNVVRNATEVAAPWRKFKKLGNSLFWWQIVFGLACLAVLIVPIVVLIVGVVVPCAKAGAFVPATIPVIVGLGIVLLLFMVAAGYVMLFLQDFVIPIMYRDDCACVEAWRRFLRLMQGHFSGFVLYGLFHFLLGLVGSAIVAGLVLVTCCLAGCLMLIPYLNAVVLLPMLVFFRLYGLEYLAQYGPEFDLLRPKAEKAAGALENQP